VSNGGLHPVEERTGSLELGPGYHSVRVDFFENEGQAAIWVDYWGPDTKGKRVLLRGAHLPAPASPDGAPIPGFKADFIFDPGMDGEAIKDENDYFAYAQSQGLSVAKTAVMETINFGYDETFRALGEDFATDKIIAQWTGVMHVRIAGEYSFSTSSDDGSHLWIDGALVVSNGGLHGVETVRGTARLDAGYHDVRVDFFENEGGAAVWVKYEGPDTDGEEVLLRGMHYAE